MLAVFNRNKSMFKDFEIVDVGVIPNVTFVTIICFPLLFPEAGLVSPERPEQLLIALEPEAASIYCRKLRLHQVIDLSLQPIRNGPDIDGTQPFDSGFRQGSEGWEGEGKRIPII